jgi:formylglycine-generating enzyme required for sulfatase activity
MGCNPSKFKGADLPVEMVSWDDVQEFIRKLNAQEGHDRYRLPTEAEWEYACRAGSDGDFGGVGRIDDMGWYKDNSDNATHPVGQKQANAWGFHDMHGNVYEWCRDWMEWYSKADETDPTGPHSGVRRVFRGGCHHDPARWGTSTYRWREVPSFADECSGFRLCMSADQDVPSGGTVSRGSGAPAASVKAPEANGERPKDMSLTLRSGVTMDFVGCPAGSFMMGKPGDSDPKSATFEHKVTITRPFWMGKYQVTWRQWKVFCKEQFGDAVAALGGLDAAKGSVQYNMAMYFCEAMTKKFKREIPQGYVCRLPTEAEWEYALRANCTDPSDPYVNRSEHEYNVIGVSKDDKMAMIKKYGLSAKQIPQILPPAKVGMKKPNAWGIYDMVGNGPEVILDTCQIRNFQKSRGRNEHNDLTGAFPYKENEIDPLYFAQDNASSPCSCHVWAGMKRAAKIGSPVVENITFRLVIGPDLLKERGIK